ncbi:N-lysine methyltransferase SMYD2-A [Dissostichus eleginoides]|uniref:[histone H3]-lysine(4) N-trimethyltransferase n=1 Tax=Dissostichus eleginoides TaxID=100907 RepID=A0AAD9BZ37_DISEL|nr:N-lysine methyltransferase SMYD2-A [Dissostichus eleginoides]
MNEGIEGTERFLSPGSGRGLRAVRHFSAGELVFACPAYSYVLTVNEREAHCENCFSRREDLFKCGKCKQAHYCNVECQRSDWTMHKLKTVRLVARIILKQRVTPERDPSERLLLLSEFEAHLDKMDSEKDEMNNADIAALHHFYSKHISDIPGDQALTELFAQQHSIPTAGYPPHVALMNHSCSPNVIVTYKGTVAEVRAIREIDPGDEVFNSYIDLLYPTEDRKERLLDSYFFSCQCTECTSKSKDKAKMETRKLSSPPEPEKIKSMVHYAKIVIEEFRRAKHYKNILFLGLQLHFLLHFHELLEICELSLEKMGAIFADTNVYMLHMMYQAMGVCLYMQDWDGALRYGEKIVQPYSVHYPAYSLNVASMYLKLGRLYLGLEKKKQGIRALKRAVAIMEMAHGKDHNYVAEVKREIEEQK